MMDFNSNAPLAQFLRLRKLNIYMFVYMIKNSFKTNPY